MAGGGANGGGHGGAGGGGTATLLAGLPLASLPSKRESAWRTGDRPRYMDQGLQASHTVLAGFPCLPTHNTSWPGNLD